MTWGHQNLNAFLALALQPQLSWSSVCRIEGPFSRSHLPSLIRELSRRRKKIWKDLHITPYSGEWWLSDTRLPVYCLVNKPSWSVKSHPTHLGRNLKFISDCELVCLSRTSCLFPYWRCYQFFCAFMEDDLGWVFDELRCLLLVQACHSACRLLSLTNFVLFSLFIVPFGLGLKNNQPMRKRGFDSHFHFQHYFANW